MRKKTEEERKGEWGVREEKVCGREKEGKRREKLGCLGGGLKWPWFFFFSLLTCL